MKLTNYSGDSEDLQYLCETGKLLRVIEVRSFKKSGKSSDEKRRNYKDTLFVEPEDGVGLYKIYAGEAFVELVIDPVPDLFDDDFEDDDFDDESFI